MSFCELILVGNVGRDPELKYTASGQAVCDFSLAVNRSWFDKSANERREETTWFKVTVWGQQAESVSQFVQKGKQVLVVGDRIEAHVFEQAGTHRASLQVTARQVRFLGGGGSNGVQDEPSYETADDVPF